MTSRKEGRLIDQSTLQRYIHKAEAELRQNILPFWIAHTVDRERGGFYGSITNALVVDREAPRGALLTSRILWTYSAAYRRYHALEYLEMARWAYHDLMTRFWDAEYGGLYWMADACGRPLRMRKQVYGQAFGIYALSEYARATGDEEALHQAIALFRVLEDHSHDPENRGYFEAYTRDWQLETDLRLSDVDLNEKKSMNTHLHVMEAYTNLLRVWDDALLRARQAELIEIMMERIVNPHTGHLILFFDECWRPRSDHISFGHDIEASWLLVEAAEVAGEHRLIEATRPLAVRIAQAVYEEALAADGGLLYEATPAGIIQSQTEWWPQAEAVVGFLNAYHISGEPHFLNAALRCWDYIEEHLVDRQYGEWFRAVNRDGTVREHELKVSFWKCPYHNGRACLEMIQRLEAL
ncbi:MAG: AGE family epimerase/isomerase [Anaerolineae bacterium]|nr:AGE family epimerase/isomerase [Anaerolineae bacterium]